MNRVPRCQKCHAPIFLGCEHPCCRCLSNEELAVAEGPDGICRLGFGARATNRLLLTGILTVQVLRTLTDKQLLSILNLGKATLAEIRSKSVNPCQPAYHAIMPEDWGTAA